MYMTNFQLINEFNLDVILTIMINMKYEKENNFSNRRSRLYRF